MRLEERPPSDLTKEQIFADLRQMGVEMPSMPVMTTSNTKMLNVVPKLQIRITQISYVHLLVKALNYAMSDKNSKA
jgi:hypothetical protein